CPETSRDANGSTGSAEPRPCLTRAGAALLVPPVLKLDVGDRCRALLRWASTASYGRPFVVFGPGEPICAACSAAHTEVLPMTDLTDLSRDHDLSALQRWLEENPTLHIAEGLSRLAPPARAVPFLLLSRDRALAVFEALDPVHQQEVLEGLRDDRFSDLVEGMDPDDRARLVGELPAKVATRLLAGLSDEERA